MRYITFNLSGLSSARQKIQWKIFRIYCKHFLFPQFNSTIVSEFSIIVAVSFTKIKKQKNV